MSKVRLYGSTSGFVELAAPAISDDGVLVLPTAAQGFGPAGIGSNVVSVTKADTFTTTSTTYVVVTGLVASITPTAATSKVLVIANLTMVTSTSVGAAFSVFADGTNIVVPTSPGSRRVVANIEDRLGTSAANNVMPRTSLIALHEPATTSSVEYDVRVFGFPTASTVAVNRSLSDSNSSGFGRTVSSITLIEVAA